MSNEKKEIKVSEVIDCLNQGMTRKEIAEHFGISQVECKQVFMHPSLKGKKARKQSNITVVDDLSENDIVNPNTEEDGVTTPEEVGDIDGGQEVETVEGNNSPNPNWEN